MRVQGETCSIRLYVFSSRLALGAHIAERRLQHLDLHIVGDLDQDFRIFGLPAALTTRPRMPPAVTTVSPRRRLSTCLAQLLGALLLRAP